MKGGDLSPRSAQSQPDPASGRRQTEDELNEMRPLSAHLSLGESADVPHSC